MWKSAPPSSCMPIFSPVTISTMRGEAMQSALMPRTITMKSQKMGV